MTLNLNYQDEGFAPTVGNVYIHTLTRGSDINPYSSQSIVQYFNNINSTWHLYCISRTSNIICDSTSYGLASIHFYNLSLKPFNSLSSEPKQDSLVDLH